MHVLGAIAERTGREPSTHAAKTEPDATPVIRRFWRFFLRTVGLLALLGLGTAPVSSSVGRPIKTSFPSDSLSVPDSVAVKKGARAVRDGRYDAAMQFLVPIMNGTVPRHPTYGSAATWLGRAFQHRGNMAQARNIWFTGLRPDRQPEGQPPPADAADAFLRSFPPGKIRNSANLPAHVFSRLLDAMGTPNAAQGNVPAPADSALRRHAAQLALIAPDSIAAPLSTYANTRLRSDSLVEAVRDLRRWFEVQDPVLATDHSERIVQHLARVRRAEQDYAWAARRSGLDDRGETLVRYGPPGRTTAVTYENRGGKNILRGSPTKSLESDDTEVKTLPSVPEALRALDLTQSAFPVENEVWIYPRQSPPLDHFIFVESEQDNQAYLTGTVQDLFPDRAQNSASAEAAHATLQLSVYKQLMSVGEYGGRYGDLYNWTITDPSFDGFVSQKVGRFESADRRLQWERKRAPKQKTQNPLSAPSMPVAVRTARFLEEDGTTRTDVYGSVRPDSLSPPDGWMNKFLNLGFEPSGSYLVQATGVLRSSALRTASRTTHLDTVSAQTTSTDAPVPLSPLLLRGEADAHRVNLEWIQYSIGTDGQKGPLVHRTERELGAQPALSQSGLEMSDLRLLSVPPDGPILPSSEVAARRRTIPFDRIEADRRIALNFHVYRLTFGAEDRTRYTVKQTAEYEREADGISGLFGGTDQQVTSTSSTYEGSKRHTVETLLLDLNKLQTLNDAVPVTLTVTVTDEITGRSVERDIEFTLTPADNPQS